MSRVEVVNPASSLTQEEAKLIRKLRRQARKRRARKTQVCSDERIKQLMQPLYENRKVN